MFWFLASFFRGGFSSLLCRSLVRIGYDLLRNLTAYSCYLTNEISNSCFFGVLSDDAKQRIITERDVRDRKSMCFKLRRYDVTFCNFKLIMFEIARDLDHFHSV